MKYSPILLESLQKRSPWQTGGTELNSKGRHLLVKQRQLKDISLSSSSSSLSLENFLLKYFAYISYDGHFCRPVNRRCSPEPFLFHICLQKQAPVWQVPWRPWGAVKDQRQDRESCADHIKHFHTLQWKEQDPAVLELQRSLLESNTDGKLKVSSL